MTSASSPEVEINTIIKCKFQKGTKKKKRTQHTNTRDNKTKFYLMNISRLITHTKFIDEVERSKLSKLSGYLMAKTLIMLV